MKRTRILLADDHPQIRKLLRVILEPEFKVVGMAEDGEMLLQYAQILQPDVVISDINMPKINGIQAAQLLKTIAPSARIIFLTSHAEPSYMASAFEAGASGYLVKGDTIDLVGALRPLIACSPTDGTAPYASSGTTSIDPRQRKDNRPDRQRRRHDARDGIR
ncbi:MAG: response regulator transcription factor [Nitrospira sp.]|nr:response regulator transcription factor [Nitrospira sp.]